MKKFKTVSILKDKFWVRIRITKLINTHIMRFMRVLRVFFPGQIELGHSGFRIASKYFICRNAGLFSLLSTTTSDILNFHHSVTKISLRFGGDFYKNHIFQNPWNCLFAKKDSLVTQSATNEVPDLREAWSENYLMLDLKRIRVLASSIFSPSEKVLDLQNKLIVKYGVSTRSLIGVHYRGTDKATEIPTVEVGKYIAEVEKILFDYPNMDILVQSDSVHALNIFRQRFGDKVKYFEELPLSDNLEGAHILEKEDRILDAVTYLAAVNILINCRYLITHTGNGGLWEFIYRDSPDGFIQLSGKSGDND